MSSRTVSVVGHVNDPLVSIKDLVVRYSYQDPPVLKNITLNVDAGEKVAIMGPSGCGKSTLLMHLAGLRMPQAGEIKLAGNELARMSMGQLDALRSEFLGFVFQTANLLQYLTTRENILLALEPIKISVEGADKLVDECIQKFGLLEVADRRAVKLSVGEAQRAAVARALVKAPKLLVADEPTGALDGKNVETITDLICGDDNRTVVLATHDERVANKCQRTLLLENGQLKE